MASAARQRAGWTLQENSKNIPNVVDKKQSERQGTDMQIGISVTSADHSVPYFSHLPSV